MTFYFASLDLSGCAEKKQRQQSAYQTIMIVDFTFLKINDEKLMMEFIEGYSHYLLCEIKELEQWSLNELFKN